MKKYNVGIIGATGMVGQRFSLLLDKHPWFNVVCVAASPRSAGKKLKDAVAGKWKLSEPLPEAIGELTVLNAEEDVEKIASMVDFVFCAVDMKKDEIRALEEKYAKAECPVVSNNSAHRHTPDVPMVIPEVNPEHIEIIASQRKRLGTKRGFIAVKSNCSLQSYVPALAPLMDKYKVTKALACTYQAISGAGKIVDATAPAITTQCLRVPVSDGHTAAVFVSFENKPSKEEILQAWKDFSGVPQELQLPSAPKQFLNYFTENDRPQAKLDRNLEGGMAVSIGRLREDSQYDYKFVCLSHNTLRGAAGGAVLLAELLAAKGYFD